MGTPPGVGVMPGPGVTPGLGVVVIVPEPLVPPRLGLPVVPDCPEPDEPPPPVAKPRKPWAAALDAKAKTTARTVAGAARYITSPDFKSIIGIAPLPSQYAKSWTTHPSGAPPARAKRSMAQKLWESAD